MKNFQQWSRRRFLGTAAGAGAAIMVPSQLSWAINKLDPGITALAAKINFMTVDTHNHIDVPLNAAELPGPKIDLAAEMTKAGLSAVSMTFAVDYQKLVNPGDAYNRFTAGLDAADAILKDNNMTRALNLKDLTNAFKAGKPTVIQSVEGGHFLEGKLERLQEAYNRGLRQLGLLHDNDASVPLGDVYTNPPQWGGLSGFGAQVIAECNRLGILIDMAHASNETLNATLKITDKPLLISHTGLDTRLGNNPDFAKMMKPRLISPAQAKIIAKSGGVIGVWTHLADTPEEFAQNIRAMADVTGIDHVCIGTDTKLTPAYHAPNAQFKPRAERVGERTNLAWKDQKEGFYYAVTVAMLKTGFKEEEIAKVAGGNFTRVFDAATKGH